MYGFFNLILKIDVGERSFSIRELSDGELEETLGGKGLGAKLLLEENPPGVAPLAPENNLIIAVGPVADTLIYGACRHGIFTKSPQTGLYSESYSGGKAAEVISRTGYDAIVIRGASLEPIFLEISDETVRFHSAVDLWGLDTYATEDKVLEKIGKKRTGGDSQRAAALVIGPAGENLVRFALIENDYWRSAGRTGVGAVLGSKKIKALCFHGKRKRPIAFPDEVAAFAREILEKGKTDAGAAKYRKLGTPMMVEVLNKAQGFPTQYWSKGVLDGWEAISAESLNERCDVTPRACARCFIACGRLSTVKVGPHKGLQIEGPEYETLYAFGGLCVIKSIEEIIYLNDLCDRLGIDTITAGNLAGLTIEASRRNKIKEKFAYGDTAAIAELLTQIAYRRGIGAVLADGIRGAAQAWGLEGIAIHVKGMEPAGYDPRVFKGMGLGYATSDRGACHLRSTFYKAELAGLIAPEQIAGKAELFIDFEDRLLLADCLITCRFYRDLYSWKELSRIVRMTTGLGWGKEEIGKFANHVLSLCRAFNLREGMTPDDDSLPERFHNEPLPESGNAIAKADLKRMIGDYYRLRGWDEQGRLPDR
ncbi:MAG: aldehyde ferredoxin oxidoreductase family protein [Syntrophobacterales bacterium]|nr:aldehyde ferredoxin oxidoreductase family protein [Syntrophobacterales bacterium]